MPTLVPTDSREISTELIPTDSHEVGPFEATDSKVVPALIPTNSKEIGSYSENASELPSLAPEIPKPVATAEATDEMHAILNRVFRETRTIPLPDSVEGQLREQRDVQQGIIPINLDKGFQADTMTAQDVQAAFPSLSESSAKVITGVTRGLNGITEGLTTPESLGAIALGGLPGMPAATGKAIGGLFGVQAAAAVPGATKDLSDAIQSGDPERIAESAVKLGASAAIAKAGLSHATASPASEVAASIDANVKIADLGNEPIKFGTETDGGRPRFVLPELERIKPALVQNLEFAKAPATAKVVAEVLPDQSVPEIEPGGSIPPASAPAKPLEESPESWGAVLVSEPPANIVGVPATQVPAAEIAVRPDLMQFKRMDESATGINRDDKLGGKWDSLKSGNLLLWEPKNPAEYGLEPGQKYIVANGHHRFAFGQEQGVEGYNAQIIRESDGVKAADARTVGAEQNIADGKGSIYDQAKFIRNAATTHGQDEALARARSIGAKGRKAATIGISASTDTFDAFVNERITPDQAEAIAKTAPGDEGLQRVGISEAVKGKAPADVANFMQAARIEAGPSAEQLDLFGNNDAALNAARVLAQKASQEQREISSQIRSVEGAARNPEKAASLGVNVENPDALNAKLKALKVERERWDNWSSQPDLVAKVTGRPVSTATPKLRPMENQGDLLSTQKEDLTLAGEKATDFEKQARDKAEADRAAAEAKALETKQQPSLVFQSTVVPGVKEFIDQDVVPGTKAALQMAADVHGEIKSILAPPNVGHLASETAGIIRDRAGELAQKDVRAAAAFENVKKQFDKNPVAINLKIIDDIELGNKQATPALDAIAKQLRDAFDDRLAQVRALGTGKLEQAIENYFPHIWKDPVKAQSLYAQFFGKRPLEGSKNFLKQRTLPTTMDGINAGLEPVSYNPVELATLKLHEIDRYIMGQKIMQEMKERGLAKYVKAMEKAPDDYQRIDDRVAQVISVRPDSTFGQPPAQTVATGLPEMVVRGHYWAPEEVARIINNYLSPGLRKYKTYNAIRATGNVLNQAQLGLSAYHLMFTAIDSATSKLALGLEQVSRGKLEGLASIAKGTIGNAVAYAPIENFIRGNKVLNEYTRAGSVGGELTKIVDGLVAAGGRVHMDKFYSNSSVANFWKALHSGNYPGAMLRAPFAALESLAKPIMEVVVPRMKLGIFADMAKMELERLGPTAGREQIRTVLGKVWDSVDNRMGQMVYDNLFWNKNVKDLSMISVRSVGWNLGTIRELGGAVRDVFSKRAKAGDPLLTHRMAYAVALPVVVGTIGAMYQYLATGRGPDEPKDLFLPKTGNKTTEGQDERVIFPSYIKDIISYVKHPVTTVENKIHPLFSAIAQMLNNKDFYGTEIRHKDDPLVQQAMQEAKFIGSSFLPFSVQGQKHMVSNSTAANLQPFVGIMPAPKELMRTAAQNKLMEYVIDKIPQGAKTQQAAELIQLKKDLVQAVKNNQDFRPKLGEAVKAGKITVTQAKNIIKQGASDTWVGKFQTLTLDEMQHVYDLGTQAEKDAWRRVLQSKLAKKR